MFEFSFIGRLELALTLPVKGNKFGERTETLELDWLGIKMRQPRQDESTSLSSLRIRVPYSQICALHNDCRDTEYGYPH